MRLLTKFIGSVLIAYPGWAVAHPVDNLCEPGKHTEDGCQEATPGLHLEDPEFFAAHKAYWHCRRNLNLMIRDYASCISEVRLLQTQLGEPNRYVGNSDLLNYWSVIPAHPELDFPGELWRPVQQKKACDDTCDVLDAWFWECVELRNKLAPMVDALISKPPVLTTVTVCCDKKKKHCAPC